MGNWNRLARFLLVSLFFAAVFQAAPIWAAGGPPMITDDPGTPGDGHWEINVAALSDHGAGVTTYQLPLVDVNYGLGERIQLKFELPWLVQDQVDGTYHSDAGDGLAGVKWRFYDAGENDWQISTYPQVEFDFPGSDASRVGMTERGASYLVPFEFVRVLEDFDVNVEIGRWFRPVQHTDSWIAGFVLTHEVRKGFEVMAELHDEVAVRRSQEELTLNFGTRLDLSERYTLLFSAGRDLRNTLGQTNTFLSYAGLQIRY